MEKSNFQFKRPKMKHFLFKMNDSFRHDLFDGISIRPQIYVGRDNEQCIAKVTLVLKIGAEEEKYPFYAELTMDSRFRWNKDTKNVDVLLRCNAPALLLSYMRPIIADATANAGLPRFDLPFMDFTTAVSDDIEIIE